MVISPRDVWGWCKAIFSVRINGIQRWHVQVYVHDSYQLNIEVWFLLQSRGRSRFIRITSWRCQLFQKMPIKSMMTQCVQRTYFIVSISACSFWIIFSLPLSSSVELRSNTFTKDKEWKKTVKTEFGLFTELTGDLSEQWSLRSKHLLQPTRWTKMLLPLNIVKLCNNTPACLSAW